MNTGLSSASLGAVHLDDGPMLSTLIKAAIAVFVFVLFIGAAWWAPFYPPVQFNDPHQA